MGTRWTQTWVGGLMAAGMAGTAILPAGLTGSVAMPTAAAGAPGTVAALVDVIVDGRSSRTAAEAVTMAGGTVGTDLPLIGGVTASVPASAVGALRAAGLSVVPDEAVHPLDHQLHPGPADVNEQVLALQPGAVGGPAAGAGVGVAIVDTGVAPVADLAGRVRAGADLTGGGDALSDGYGHGTFVAGLVAGRHTGAAPGAEVISIKVAGDDGTTTLGTLIEAIGWAVVEQEEQGIDVLNLSFGTLAPMAAPGDPLVQAVEAAWASGLVVVLAAGNEGEASGQVTSPGTSPSALTVGATDHAGTADPSDDVVAPWSSSVGGKTPKPELVAPGTSLISLRVPGSTVDRANADNAVQGDHGPDYFVGSGTSMSTALASGAAAVVLSAHPGATPGDVKSALVDTGVPVTGGGTTIDLEAAVTTTATGDPVAPVPGRRVGHPVRAEAPAAGWAGARWTGARWTGARWTGARWTDSEWAGARWTGARWTGARWTGARWTGARWTGARWTMVSENGLEP